MRVISGTARGIKLSSLDGLDTRPTLDNVKEAIFSMIFLHTDGARVLDLFAGSGAMGIEALSRGADEAVFVDSNPKACEVVRANLTKARMSDKARVVCASAQEYIDSIAEGESFDLIFLDPPYALGLLDETIDRLCERALVKKGGLIIAEADNGTPIDVKSYKLLKQKKYGRVLVYILEA